MATRIESSVQKAQTKQKLLISEIRYRRLFEAARDGILLVDVDTRKITDANPFMSELMGFSKDELLGKELWEIGLLKDAEVSQAAFLELQTNRYVRYEDLPLQTKEGKHWYVEFISNIYQENGQEVIQCNIRDITQRKRTEVELEHAMISEKNARLDSELANRTKDRFLAIVSHELRTPLNAIIGWTHLLRKGELDESQRERALEVIERNGKLQAQLIEDLLDSSRILAGHLDIKVGPLNLGRVIDSAVDSMMPSANAKSIQIQSHLDPEVGKVSADPNRLQQVIANLLSNAVKFTPNGGLVDIWLEKVNSDARVTVTDTGDGFDPDFLPYAFDIFRQGDGTTTRTHGGLGLGLTIARKIVDMHGGTLNAENRTDQQGASLTLSLPLINNDLQISTQLPLIEAENNGEIRPALTGWRVLIVDDESTSLEMLDTLLNHWGATVKTSESALDALELYRNWKPDLLISDIAMPEKDGNWLIAKIREIERTRDAKIPAIAFTAYVSPAERDVILDAGYDEIMSKPIEQALLLSIMSRLATAVSY